MKRIEAIAAVAEYAGDALIVCNIGFPSRELFAVKDRNENFYMLGSMGLASSIGLGVALARTDRRVVAIDGDGAVLMNLGTLATLADQAPDNYLLVIIDNEAYGSTGGQSSCTARSADLGAIALGAGVKDVRTAWDEPELVELLRTMASGVLVARVDSQAADGSIIELPPRDIADRFMAECQRPSG